MPAGAALYALFGVLALTSILSFVLRRSDGAFARFIMPVSYVIMGCVAIVFSFCVVNEILNLLNLIVRIKKFRYYSTLVTLIISALSCVWSLCNTRFILNIKEVTITVPELKLDSLRIVQLSDIHINQSTNPKVINEIFDKTMALDPDIIVITGDVIDTDINKDDRYKAYGFEKLKAKYGVYAITGNHEYYTGVEIYNELCRKLHFTVLNDENILIPGVINIAGINDRNHDNAAIIEGAISGADKEYPVLFLSHQPGAFNHAAKLSGDYRIIQLSGHTHAGQIPPVEIALRFFMDYCWGLYYRENAVLYVTSGTRWWGPPMRFGNVSEIVEITLVP
jgi:predicted MPP superfamily phosphohydrolase